MVDFRDNLVAEDTVECLIGFHQGSYPLFFFRRIDKIDQLVAVLVHIFGGIIEIFDATIILVDDEVGLVLVLLDCPERNL